MAKQSAGLVGTVLRFASGLRFPWLFAMVAFLFGVDLLLPDVFPFVDELLLGLLTLTLGSWRRRKDTLANTVEGTVTSRPSEDASTTPTT
jgi:hypothetical protein